MGSSPLRPFAEEAELHVEGYDANALRVVSLNLGGRNTNPVEFELKGDSSEVAAEAVSVLRKAGKAIRNAEEGPLMMPAAEMKVIEEILALIFKDFQEEAPSEWQSRILELFRCETWQNVLSSVKATNAHAFNAFNLSTLKLDRPSVWENPASCKHFTNTQDSFTKATDVSGAVMRRMEELVDKEAEPESQKAWRTTGSRLAAVSCQSHPDLGGSKVCFVSLHVSKSDCTAAFIEKLRDALEDYDADVNVVGLDSNCSGEEACAFQKRLRSAGFEIGCAPKQQQVTVAKQRTAFQTQILKVGDVDVSHKDYIVSWASPQVRRGRTSYTPDLRTCYGVEQETKQCVRLPTTKWPFDHCGVVTTFKPKLRCKGNLRCTRVSLRFCALVLFLCLLAASPWASGTRKSPYGEPGAWLQDAWIFTPRRGICEVAMPCPKDWLQHAGSCYFTTPKLAYPDVQLFCESFNGSPIAIGSEAENDLVLQQSLCPKGDFCYIGLLGDHAGANYWVTGEAYNYSRLLEKEASSIPFFENSRSTEYVATILANSPSEVDGCDFRLASQWGVSAYEVFSTNAYPVLAMLVSGFLVALPRPSNQRLASSLLLLAFVVNILWTMERLLSSCFVDNYSAKAAVYSYGNFADAAGHTATSVLSLWMIVRRMCMLYPARALKRIFWVLLASIFSQNLITVLFVDASAPLAATWPVMLLLVSFASTVVLYIAASVTIFFHLYHTWACLQEEATKGYNSRGTTLRQSVRAAKLHLFVALFAIMSGALRWASMLAVMIGFLLPGFPIWIGHAYMLATLVDSITNDSCAHLLACMNMDAAVIRAKGVTMEVAERAEREVEQHRLAVRMLKAAPTSGEQLQQLMELENKARAALGTEQEKSAFLILQSAVRVESARIHRLMHCVRVRAMTMGLRYQYLMEIPSLDSSPRQPVPEKFSVDQTGVAADKYFTWLYGEASGAQQVLFQQLQQLLTKFNNTDWPSYLGLAPEEFPWRIWSSASVAGMSRLQKEEVISPGDTLVYCPNKANCLAGAPSAPCIILEETAWDAANIHCSGMESPQEVPRDRLRTSHGGGVFIPGPQKKKQRCLDKIVADYEGSAQWPAAASLVDICRCMLVCDDPYAVAVLVAYIRRNMKVVRLKNRFSEDVMESRPAEDLQSMFYDAADASASDTQTNHSTHNSTGEQQYRDVSMNVAIKTPSGIPFICEVQVTLSNLAILKRAEQKLYTIRRMKSPAELSKSRTFEAARDELGHPRTA